MNARRLRLAGMAFFALTLIAGACSSSTPRTETGATGDNAAAPRTDGEIVATLAASDRGEISQGNLAQSRAQNADVRAFGQNMVAMHSEASSRMSSMAQSHNITPEPNAASQRLTSEGEAVERRLSGLSGAEFDRAYMDAQVNAHSQVLDMIDRVMIPRARHDDLRAALRDQVRPMVASHLQQARDLRGRL